MHLQNQKQRFRTRGGHKIYQKTNKNRSKIYANRSKIGLKIGPKSVSKSVQFWGPKSGHLSNGIAVFGNPPASKIVFHRRKPRAPPLPGPLSQSSISSLNIQDHNVQSPSVNSRALPVIRQPPMEKDRVPIPSPDLSLACHLRPRS